MHESVVKFMKRVHAFVSGEVQGVGYREEVKRIAFDLNICGFIMNLEDGRVELTAEGENKNIEEFLNKINIRKYPIFVEEVRTVEEIYQGYFKSFKIVRDKDLQKEILSAISRGTVEIQEMKEILRSVSRDTAHIPEIRENTAIMLEKQDNMLEKQDLQTEITKKGFNDMRKGFADLKEEIRAGFTDIKEEIHLQRNDFREVFMHEVSELRSEIAEIKATLVRMQAAE